MARDSTRFVTSWIFGILAVILLVFIINAISFFVRNPFMADLVSFINGNIILLIVISFLFFIGSYFYSLGFPGNLAFPVFDAFGGGFLVTFLINLVVLIDNYVLTGIGGFLEAYSWTTSVIVFFIILIFGYISVFQSSGRQARQGSDRREREEIIEETTEGSEEPRSPSNRRKVFRRTIRKNRKS